MSLPEPVLALEIAGLRKSFDRPAVNGFDLAVRAGEFYALLGPNGAFSASTRSPMRYRPSRWWRGSRTSR